MRNLEKASAKKKRESLITSSSGRRIVIKGYFEVMKLRENIFKLLEADLISYPCIVVAFLKGTVLARAFDLFP